MKKPVIVGVLLFTSIHGWAAIARDINISIKRSNTTSSVTPSTSTANSNEMILMIGAQNTSTPKIPTTTASVTFTTFNVTTNGGTVAAWVAASTNTIPSKTFTWNSTAASGIVYQLVSFTGTAASPGCPLCGLGASATSIAANPSTTLTASYTSTWANSQGYASGVDASNSDTLSTDAGETFDVTYTTDSFSAWSGAILHQNSTTSSPGTVVTSSMTGVTSFGSSLAMLNLEIIPATAPFVTTTPMTSITKTTAQGNGVVYTGGAAFSDTGVCYNTAGNPTTSDTCVSAGSTNEGAISVSFTGLTENTVYHARAYATNANGTSYGYDAWFRTLPTPVIGHPPGTGRIGLFH